MKSTHSKKEMKHDPLNAVKTLVREGKLDDDTAQFLKSLAKETVVIRNAGRTMLEAYRAILDAIAAIRGNLNVVLDNVEDTENYADE